jgi:C-terminal processing protease CtpA/Prc
MVPPYPLVTATKPVLVLHDELSVSGGDAFPMVMQSGGFKTFGARTGGLGGSVEAVLTLPHSAARLSLTRGLFAAHNPAGGGEPVTRLIENNGITPDYPHAVTVADMRAGYVGYVDAFSDVVVNLAEERAPRQAQ